MSHIVERIQYLGILFLVMGLVGACGPQNPDETMAVDDGSATAATTPTRAEVMNATLSGIYEGPITLVEGEYEGEPFDPEGASRPRVHLITELMPAGDLDGNGIDEVVALVEETSGGTGHFLYLVPLATVDGVVRQLGVANVGDRVKIRSVGIEDGSIVMQTIEAGPDDAACCPTLKKKRTWTVTNGALSEMAAQIEGPVSLKDLEGPEWVLVAFNPGEPAPETPEVTFKLNFEEMKVSGSSGCNGFVGTIEDTGPGRMTIGPLAGTRKMCPPDQMDVETRFLKALDGATGHGFFLGQMAIEYQDGEDFGMLLFTARDEEAGPENIG
jgi:heat shock protein HslJ